MHRSEMTRRCSHCSNNGHNSRTCPNRGVKIFGVRFTDGAIRKSASMGNLRDYSGLNGGASPADGVEHGGRGEGYASEDLGQGSNSGGRERKKGVPWTEEEHRMFLLGLSKLGKGDWRGIARNYVTTRTPTQVASHAQKYFIRQSNASRRKRRTSLFDMVPDEPIDAQLFHVGSQDDLLALPAPPALDEECESMDSNSNDEGSTPAPAPAPLPMMPESFQYPYPVIYPAVMAPFYPYHVPFWPGYRPESREPQAHEIVKPTAIHPKAPINVDELGSMARLSLRESMGDARPSFLSLKMPDGSERHSAFNARPPSGSAVDSSSNAAPAVY